MSASITSGSFPSLPSSMSGSCDMGDGMYSKAGSKLSSADTKALGERVVNFLRHRHPAKTAANVAADIGMPSGTVAKWLEGAATPGGYAVFKLIDFYGGDFVASVWPKSLGFLSEAARADRERRLDAKIAALTAEKARL